MCLFNFKTIFHNIVKEMAQSVKSSPRDAQVMSTILADMGITEYEPRVINQMLEFSYREYILFFPFGSLVPCIVNQ